MSVALGLSDATPLRCNFLSSDRGRNHHARQLPGSSRTQSCADAPQSSRAYAHASHEGGIDASFTDGGFATSPYTTYYAAQGHGIHHRLHHDDETNGSHARAAKVARAPNAYVCATPGCGIAANQKKALMRCAGRCPMERKPHYCSKECQRKVCLGLLSYVYSLTQKVACTPGLENAQAILQAGRRAHRRRTPSSTSRWRTQTDCGLRAVEYHRA